MLSWHFTAVTNLKSPRESEIEEQHSVDGQGDRRLPEEHEVD